MALGLRQARRQFIRCTPCWQSLCVPTAGRNLPNGRGASLSSPDGYALILPDLSKMTPFTREAIMSAVIEGMARKG
jgi:hypothetical protein